jgi:hypothetical protein
MQFKGETPVWAKVLVALMLVNAVLQIAAGYWVPNHAPIYPDASHPYRIQARGGPPYFVQPWVGLYYDYGFYAVFVLIGVFLLLLWINRDKIERVR